MAVKGQDYPDYIIEQAFRDLNSKGESKRYWGSTCVSIPPQVLYVCIPPQVYKLQALLRFSIVCQARQSLETFLLVLLCQKLVGYFMESALIES
jgi:hypothetical protein